VQFGQRVLCAGPLLVSSVRGRCRSGRCRNLP